MRCVADDCIALMGWRWHLLGGADNWNASLAFICLCLRSSLSLHLRQIANCIALLVDVLAQALKIARTGVGDGAEDNGVGIGAGTGADACIGTDA